MFLYSLNVSVCAACLVSWIAKELSHVPIILLHCAEKMSSSTYIKALITKASLSLSSVAEHISYSALSAQHTLARLLPLPLASDKVTRLSSHFPSARR